MVDTQRYGKRLYLLALVPPLVAILTIVFAPDPHGHWSEHLWGAYLDGAQLVLLVVLAAILAMRDSASTGSLVSVLLLLSFAVVAVGIVYEVLGNYQVAQSIWRTPANPGFGDGYNQGHERAETGDLLVIIGGAAFAFIAGLSRRVSFKIAVLALLMVIIPPPFVWPAAGVLMLMLYGLTADTRFDRRAILVTE